MVQEYTEFQETNGDELLVNPATLACVRVVDEQIIELNFTNSKPVRIQGTYEEVKRKLTDHSSEVSR